MQRASDIGRCARIVFSHAAIGNLAPPPTGLAPVARVRR